MKNNKSNINWQRPLSILLLILGVAGFLWVLVPSAKDTILLDLQEIRIPLNDDSNAMMQTPYQMQIVAPKQARAGKQFGYSFKLSKSSQPLNITGKDVNIYDYFQVNLQLRPDFENTTINPPGSMTTALLPGQEPAMTWKMDPLSKEDIKGTFWVYMDFVPLVEGVEEMSTALLARNVTIPVKSALGLNTRWVTILSTALTVAAVFLGIPQLPFFKGGITENAK